jgi:hypothetical protein
MYSVFPTGVTRYEPERAHNSYVLFDGRDGQTHLIDMNGNDVHTWDYIGFPSHLLEPTVAGGQRGHVLVQLAGKSTPGPILFNNLFNNQAIGELDWDGNVVWQWGARAPGGAANQSHDWHRLPNGNTLLVATRTHAIAGFRAEAVHDQVIYEIAPAGEVVWQWVVSEHLDEFGFSPEGLALIRAGFSTSGGRAGFLTINKMTVLGPNRWFAAGDTRFHPDNLMIDAREGNFVAIIEKRTGTIVWRLGPSYPDAGVPPGQRIYQARLPRPVDQLSGQHDAHLIAEGLPGAGDVLVFDNQGAAGFPPAALGHFVGSRVLQIDPIQHTIVWQYTGADSQRDVWTFHSSFLSSARRLPNGNTLICEGMTGRLFQVTPAGDIVWEYVNPYFARAFVGGREILTHWTYRAQPVPYAWVPPQTPRSESPVRPPDVTQFRVPAGL